MDKKEIFINAIKNNEGILYKISSIYTNSIDDRNDLMQEIIYQLWKSFDSFNQESSFSTWMYRVSMNVAVYHLKITKRKVLTVPLNEKFLDFYEPGNDGFEENMQLFKQLLDKLNLLDKGIIILYLENKSHEEISEIVGISKSNVGTKISRIKSKLEKQITKYL